MGHSMIFDRVMVIIPNADTAAANADCAAFGYPDDAYTFGGVDLMTGEAHTHTGCSIMMPEKEWVAVIDGGDVTLPTTAAFIAWFEARYPNAVVSTTGTWAELLTANGLTTYEPDIGL